MNPETILNAMDKVGRRIIFCDLVYGNVPEKHKRQFCAFRSRILREFEELQARIEELEDDLSKALFALDDGVEDDCENDWYKDKTANREYERKMQARYSDYKLQARIWEERAERMKKDNTRLVGLLKRVEWIYYLWSALAEGYNVPIDEASKCMFCKRFKFQGHTKECELAAVLGKGGE